MASDKLLNYCLENLEGTVVVESWGKKGFSITHTMYCNGCIAPHKKPDKRNQRI